MRKRATGLTSIPIPDVPGSENVEVKDIEPEDAEAANHGGFNQMEPSNFAKDLEMVKRMRRLKKKASEIFTDLGAVQDAASRFGVQINSEDPEVIFKDFLIGIVLKTDVFWGYGNFPAEAPVMVKKDIIKFWEDLWKRDSLTTAGSYKEFLDNKIDTGYWKTVGVLTGTGALVGGAAGMGAATPFTGTAGALVGGAAGMVGGAFMQWNDEEIGKIEDFYNVLLDYKKSLNKANTQSNSPSSISTTTFAPASAVAKSEVISYPVGTKLKDKSGGYSYRVVSPSEIEITKLNGSTVNVTPDTASQHGVNWDAMILSLNDSSQTEKSANYNFNITKVSKDMRNELKKLNAALNGLGYRNLIKTAETNKGLLIGRLYLHKTGDYAIKCLSPHQTGSWYEGGDTEGKAKVIWLREGLTDAYISHDDGSSRFSLDSEYELADRTTDEWDETTCDDLAKLGGTLSSTACKKAVDAAAKSAQPASPGAAASVRLSPAATKLVQNKLRGNIYYFEDTDVTVGFPSAVIIKISEPGSTAPNRYDLKSPGDETKFSDWVDAVVDGVGNGTAKLVGSYPKGK